MLIGLIGCWHDDNRGDSAILFGLLNNLYQSSPGLEVRAFSLFSDACGPFRTAFRHVQTNFPQLKVYPSPFPDIYNQDLGFLQRIQRLNSILYYNLMANTLKNNRIWLRLLESDLIISVGGYRLKSPRGDLVDLIRVVFHATPFLMLQKYGKKYVIDAQSIGPIIGKIHRRIVRSVLDNAIIVGLRESISYQEVLSLGLTSNLRLLPDAAFSLKPMLSDRVRNFLRSNRLLNRPYVILAPRQWFWRRPPYYDAYIEVLAQFARVLQKEGYIPVLVAHSIGPISLEDDRVVCWDIASRIKDIRPIIVDEDWTPSELAAFYGCAAAVIGVRLHAALLALLSGTPSIAIAYEGPKTQGIMRYLNLDYFVITIRSLSLNELLIKFEASQDMRNDIQSDVGQMIEMARKERDMFINELIEKMI